MKHWIFLCIAIIAEVLGTTSMKLSEGFTHIIPSILLFFFYAISFIFLTLALKIIEVSVAYAVWSGFGMLLIALIGFFFFREQWSVLKIISILLIVAGVIGLNLSMQTH